MGVCVKIFVGGSSGEWWHVGVMALLCVCVVGGGASRGWIGNYDIIANNFYVQIQERRFFLWSICFVTLLDIYWEYVFQIQSQIQLQGHGLVYCLIDGGCHCTWSCSTMACKIRERGLYVVE